jgi:outer membrane protein
MGICVMRVCLVASVAVVAFPRPARPETLPGALAKAYGVDPELNAGRAALRATDEDIAKAQAGYRPSISASGDVGPEYRAGKAATANRTAKINGVTVVPRRVALHVDQNIWNGDRTENSVRQAESKIIAARETLRNTEQNVLQTAAGYYMDVLRDTAILNLEINNLEVLLLELRDTRARFAAGDRTVTDVAQAASGLAQGRAAILSAQSALQTSLANYRKIVGENSKRLEPAQPLDKGLPKSLEVAIAIALAEHPSIQAALHGADAAQLHVKVLEGALYPTLDVVGDMRYDADVTNESAAPILQSSLGGQVSYQLYDGGLSFADIREGKERLAEQRIVVDKMRDAVRQSVVSAWGIYANAKGQIEAAVSRVAAEEIALAGVRMEATFGERTTLDVLNALQDLLNARVALIRAQHDRVVASYALAAAIGRLSADRLGLAVARYDPVVHFNQVKDKWWGLRTPDGR